MWTEAQNKALITDGRLLVSASAGSGKTTVMMERAARFLEQGGDVNRMVVLTFTKAAAAEMKEKLLKILYERIRQGVNRAHLMQTVKKIPTARICTIDSFCLELYRTYFERLGLSPDLAPMETEESEALFRGAAKETLTNAADGDEKTVSFLERYTKGQKLDALMTVMERLWKFSAVKPSPEEYLMHATDRSDLVLECDLAEKRKRAARLIERAEELFPMLAENWEKGFEALQEVVVNLRLVTDCKNYEDYISTFWKRTEMEMPRGKKDDLQKAWKEDVELLKNSCKTLWDKDLSDDILSESDGGGEGFFVREVNAREDATILCALTLDAYRRYQETKGKENLCDFADLEHTALKLLEDEDVLKEVRESVDCVFVDEYQDTNGLQESILNRFAGQELFMVGDVKQSIYRFRFAEPRLFLDRRRLFQNSTEGENVDLNHNFRSEPEILNFVNMVMAEVMTQDFGGVDYRKDAMLMAGKETRGTAEMQVYLYEAREKTVVPNGEIYSVREGSLATSSFDPVEGEYIADTIRRLVGKAEIPDKEGVRKVRYSDIAVLTRSHNAADLFAALEKYRIPYSAEGYKGLEGEEKRVLWNLAKVLDNALDDVPLASVMLSIWGFTEGELMCLADKKGFAHGALYAPVEDALKEKVARFRAELNRFRVRAGFMGVDEILTEVMRETGYDAVLARRGGNALARANAFLYRIQTNKYRRDLPAFLANFPKDAEENVAGETDAVRFLTIHKSKGLEFPVVFVAHAHEGFRKARVTEMPVIADAEWGVAMRYRKDYRERLTAGYLALAGRQEREERAELSRLMYVAFTRAQSKLFVTGKAPKRIGIPAEGGSIAEWLQYAAERNAKLQPYFLEGGFDFSRGEMGRVEETPDPTCTVSLNPTYKYTGGVKLGNKYAVSGLEKIDLDDVDKKQIFGFSGSQSAETGTAYHLIMEKLDFANRTEEAILRLKEEYRAVAGMENVDEKLLAKALKNPLFDGAEQYPLMKEAPFMMFCEGETVLGEKTDERTLVQGVVDLAILKPDGAVLVDYKVSGAPEEVLKERYAVQTKTYRRALEESGIPVKEVYLLILNRNLLIKMS